MRLPLDFKAERDVLTRFEVKASALGIFKDKGFAVVRFFDHSLADQAGRPARIAGLCIGRIQ